MLLSIQSLSFSWLDEILFDNVSCELENGQIIFLKGENGSGKTTLLHLISGMIPHFHRGKLLSGNILINGTSIIKHSPKEFFSKIAFIPSKHIEFFLLTESLTEEILLLRAALNRSHKEIKEKYKDFENMFPEISKIKELFFKQMNLQQKILSLLLIYYLQSPALYLIDEVLNAFPSVTEQEIWLNFFDKQARQNCSVIIVSHQIELIKYPVWKIHNNKIIC